MVAYFCVDLAPRSSHSSQSLLGLSTKLSMILELSIDHMRNAMSARHHQWEMSGPEIAATITAKVCTYWDMQNMEEDKVRLQQEKRLRVLAKAIPSYPLAGPALLHTHFQYNLLLSHSTPLRPLCTAPSPTRKTPDAAPVLVPTPVSPTVLLGTASEKLKSLEAAAQILAKEVIESVVWNDAWHANIVDC
jgi:hypothetical protein